MNRPTPVKPDNFFLMIYRALSQRRVPLALRIACTNIFLVALALVIYACVMGLQFKQAMHEQADALGQSLIPRLPPRRPSCWCLTTSSVSTCCWATW